MTTCRLADDVYGAVLQIANDLALKEKRRVSMSDAVLMLITFCPAVDKEKLVTLKRKY